MSKLVAFAAIQGAYNIVSKVEGEYKRALETYNADTKVGFPNTAYYLPVIYSLLGIKVENARGHAKSRCDALRKLLPPHVKGMQPPAVPRARCWMPAWPPCSPSRSGRPCAT